MAVVEGWLPPLAAVPCEGTLCYHSAWASYSGTRHDGCAGCATASRNVPIKTLVPGCMQCHLHAAMHHCNALVLPAPRSSNLNCCYGASD